MIVETFNGYYSVEEPRRHWFVVTKVVAKHHDPQVRVAQGRVIEGDALTMAVGGDLVVRHGGVLVLRTSPIVALWPGLSLIRVSPSG